MIARDLQHLMTELDGWASGLPDGAVRIHKQLHPPDDDYGAVAVYVFEPASSNGCALEVILVDGEDGAAIGLVLDSFERIARRIGADKPGRFAGLFREPRHLPVRHAMELCRSVADGRVEITAGLWMGRVAATRGAIVAPIARRRLDGVGGPLWLYWALQPFRLTRVVKLEFQPWA